MASLEREAPDPTRIPFRRRLKITAVIAFPLMFIAYPIPPAVFCLGIYPEGLVTIWNRFHKLLLGVPGDLPVHWANTIIVSVIAVNLIIDRRRAFICSTILMIVVLGLTTGGCWMMPHNLGVPSP